MTYAILSLITLVGVILYLDLRLCKLEKYIKWHANEITRLNFELSNLRIKFENIFKENTSE